jgi:hypothetical protein
MISMLTRVCEFNDVQCAWARFLVAAGIALGALLIAVVVFVIAMRTYRKSRREAQAEDWWEERGQTTPPTTAEPFKR